VLRAGPHAAMPAASASHGVRMAHSALSAPRAPGLVLATPRWRPVRRQVPGQALVQAPRRVMAQGALAESRAREPAPLPLPGGAAGLRASWRTRPGASSRSTSGGGAWRWRPRAT